MNIIGLLLHLFVILFNKLSTNQKRIYFEVGNGYQIEMNVSSLHVKKENMYLIQKFKIQTSCL